MAQGQVLDGELAVAAEEEGEKLVVAPYLKALRCARFVGGPEGPVRWPRAQGDRGATPAAVASGGMLR